MSLASFFGKQFIDIIQWPDQADNVLLWQFPMQEQEIQTGASLTVRESQLAIFVNEGKIADVFGPGMHKLSTQTLPILTYLKNWDKLFESPFKSDVYFVSTKQMIGQRWGTPQPVTIRDKDFGMVRMRAFGVYSFRITDAKKFFTELGGNRPLIRSEDIADQLDAMVVADLANAIGGSGVPFLDMAANQSQMASTVQTALAPTFTKVGLGLESFVIQSISLPEELQQALDTRISMGMAGDLNAYTKFQTANAIPMAAQNEGGIAGLAAGFGAGNAVGAAMAGSLAGSLGAAGSAAAAASTVAASSEPSAEERLGKLKGLLEKGLINQADFDTAKAEVLRKLAG